MIAGCELDELEDTEVKFVEGLVGENFVSGERCCDVMTGIGVKE